MEGLLLIDKPKGLTSHDVVLALRRRLPPQTKVGHSGTLDPMATGLLILLIGRATKSAASYQGMDKVYSGSVRLGVETDSGDLDGQVLRMMEVPPLRIEDVQSAMDAHLGRLEMPPPMFSAVKYKGRPLYKYARKGIEVPLQNRSCQVHYWKLSGWSFPEAAFRLSCSHGTYVRSLAVSLGKKLACVATLSVLRRERIGDYSVEDALALDAACGLSWTELAARLLPHQISEPTMSDPRVLPTTVATRGSSDTQSL